LKNIYIIGNNFMNSKGFTLIEMIVVMAVFLFIVASAIGIFISVIKSESQILSQQQALSQISYIEEYMSRAIKSAVPATSDESNCIATAGQVYSFSGADTNGFHTGIRFLNSSDVKVVLGVSYNACDEFDLNAITGILEEKKAYGPNYDMNANPVPISSSDFKISSIRFAVDGLNQKVLAENKKPFLLADVDKNSLINFITKFLFGNNIVYARGTPGLCGPASRIYYSGTGFGSDTYCHTGIPDNSPAFPLSGQSVTWTCLGQNGGSNSDLCTATNASSAPPTTSSSTSQTKITMDLEFKIGNITINTQSTFARPI